MRVLILNQYALPAGEAGITRHGDISAELVRRGHDVTVIASDFDYFTRQRTRRGGGSKASLHDGVTFRWLRTGEYVGNDRRRVSSMARFAMAATWAGWRQGPAPDVIIGSSPQPLAPLAAHLVARLRRLPWIFEARDIWPSALVDLKAIERNGLAHRALEWLERYLYERASAVVTVPPRGSLRLEELGLDTAKVVHIPNGASTLLSAPGPIPESLDRLLPDKAGGFVLVYAGAIGVPHGFETVVEAVRCLKETRADLYEQLTVLIVGDGVAAQSLRDSAHKHHLDRLRVHGAIPKAAMRTLLARADACLMQAAASDHFKYGFSPNKLFDYFAAAKPVLIASAAPTIVDEARAGARFAPGVPAALASAIAGIMETSDAERRAMGERGRRLVDTDYSIKSITDRYESLLVEVVTRAARGDSTLNQRRQSR
jgi:glycosyltransferase involved in cell wall biosynthesis